MTAEYTFFSSGNGTFIKNDDVLSHTTGFHKLLKIEILRGYFLLHCNYTRNP